LAAADLNSYICWVTLGKAAGSPLGNALSLTATFLKVVGPAAPGPNAPVDWLDPKHHAAVEKLSRPQPFVFNRISP
jgi:hypothetical protein